MLRIQHKSLALALIVVGLVSISASTASAHIKPRLDIRVTDAETEKPVGIPRVKLFHILTDELEHNISCDAQGMASANIKPGMYRVTIERYGYQKKEIKLLMGLGSKTLRVQLNSNAVATPTPAPAPIPAPVPTPAPVPVAKGTLFVHGRLTLPSGVAEPKSGIAVRVFRANNLNTEYRSASTNNQGNVIMTFEPGSYVLQVSRVGFATKFFPITMVSGGTSSHAVTLKK